MKNVLIVWVLMLASNFYGQIDINLHIQTLDQSGIGEENVDVHIVGFGLDSTFLIDEMTTTETDGKKTLIVTIDDQITEAFFLATRGDCAFPSASYQEYEKGVLDYDFILEGCDTVPWQDSCFAAIECDTAGDLVAIGFGKPDFTYKWSTGDTTQTITPADTGEYCVTITDADGCAASTCINLHGGGGPGPDSCFAMIELDWGGELIAIGFGQPAFTYEWNTGETTQNITPTDSGSYCVTITDANDCVADACFDYFGGHGGPDSCWAFIDCDPLGNLVAVGFGTPDFTYDWSTGDTTQMITPTDSGEYCVTITDARGCVAETCVNLHGGGGPIDSCNTYINVYAVKDEAQLYAQSFGIPPYTYEWSTGETTDEIIVNQEGNYCVSVTDATGCVSENCTDVLFPRVPDSLKNKIFGYITLDSATATVLKSVEVELYKDENGKFELYKSVSGIEEATGIFFSYSFEDLEKGSYIVKAIPASNNDKALVTYSFQAPVWDEAEIIEIDEDFAFAPVFLLQKIGLKKGTSKVEGNIVSKSGLIANSPEGGNIPIEGLHVYLLDELDQVLALSITDVEGYYSYDNLAAGTYYLTYDLLNKESKKIEIIVSEGTTHTISIEIEDQLTSTFEEFEISLHVYPNPVHDLLNLRLDRDAIGGKMVLSDLLGNQLIQKEIASTLETIELSDMDSGIYLISIRKGDQIKTQKVFKN